MLQPRERRLRPRGARPSTGLNHLKRRIMPKPVGVIDVRVPRGDLIQPLADEHLQVVGDVARIPRVADPTDDIGAEPALLIEVPDEQQTSIRREGAAREIDNEFGLESEAKLRITVCSHRTSSVAPPSRPKTPRKDHDFFEGDGVFNVLIRELSGLVACLRSPVNTEGGDAPGAQGAEEEGAYRAYVTDGNAAPGCSAGPMRQDLGTANSLSIGICGRRCSITSMPVRKRSPCTAAARELAATGPPVLRRATGGCLARAAISASVLSLVCRLRLAITASGEAQRDASHGCGLPGNNQATEGGQARARREGPRAGARRQRRCCVPRDRGPPAAPGPSCTPIRCGARYSQIGTPVPGLAIEGYEMLKGLDGVATQRTASGSRSSRTSRT